MSIIPSLGTAISGINAFQNGLTVVSDNIANTDTTAFKEQDILFAEMISRFNQCGGARYQTGRGVLVDAVRAPFKQGTFEHTNNKLDMAIDGDGFFMLKDPSAAATIPFFTRAGAFHLDNKGFVVNTDGRLLQGATVTVNPVTGKPTAGAAAGNIDLSKVIAPPKATTKVNSTLNLFSGEPDPLTSVNGVVPTNTTDGVLATSFVINGVDITGGGDLPPGIDSLIAAINTFEPITGVHADENSTDLLKLTNPNGGAIVITLHSDIDPDVVAKTGLDSGSFQGDGGKILTGTVTQSGVPGEENIAIGQDTKFKTELMAGDALVLGSKAYIVQSVESDTQLTVTENIDPALQGPTVTASVRNATFSSPATVFDSLGVSHLINLSFIKEAPTVTTDPITNITTSVSQWGWSAVVGKNDNQNGAFDQTQATGTMTFTSDGRLKAITTLNPPPTGGFDFKGGATQDQQIAFNFMGVNPDGSDGATQFGTQSASAVIKQTQDGFSAGVLQSVSVDPEGFINGLFTNGTTQALAQVLLATFPNEDGLVRVGGNSYIQAKESGDPLIAAAGTGGRGMIQSGELEVSNVDLTKQFVKLITYQRAFQANSKVIMTSDEVIQDIVNLKR